MCFSASRRRRASSSFVKPVRRQTAFVTPGVGEDSEMLAAAKRAADPAQFRGGFHQNERHTGSMRVKREPEPRRAASEDRERRQRAHEASKRTRCFRTGRLIMIFAGTLQRNDNPGRRAEGAGEDRGKRDPLDSSYELLGLVLEITSAT